MDSVEMTARTVEEAVELALKELGVRRDEVEIEIISKGKAGILGLGAEPARVRLTRRGLIQKAPAAISRAPAPPPAPYVAPPSISRPPVSAQPAPVSRPPAVPARDVAPAKITDPETAKGAREVLEALLGKMGVEAKVDLVGAQPDENDPERLNISFNILGDDSGLLIGRRGETLGSLQFLANFIFNRQRQDHSTLLLDVEGYRERRYESIRLMVQRMAKQVASSGSMIVMAPMPPAERRIVHMELADHQYVMTESTGEGSERKVQIMPRPGAPPPPSEARRDLPARPSRPPMRRRDGPPAYGSSSSAPSKGIRFGRSSDASRFRRPGALPPQHPLDEGN